MADPVTIARPYAEAAFRLAQEPQEFARWSDMLALTEAVVADPQIAQRIGDPHIDAATLEGAILGILGERLDGHGRNFVQLLIENRRLELLPHIHTLYEALRREHDSVLEARIISAFPIEENQARPLIAALEAKYRRKVNARLEVDSALIGGARIVIGDQVIDATVRGRLDAMAASLAA